MNVKEKSLQYVWPSYDLTSPVYHFWRLKFLKNFTGRGLVVVGPTALNLYLSFLCKSLIFQTLISLSVDIFLKVDV